ncbi:hypothetical protein QBC36DRAFT_332332 [Triangularia setosa]|uniref:Regulator of chromosome condensation-like protein n=1 Tax=Triangularia setosa TaxID=2587417 RepID=A0AAN6W429_9PEZI|nr:hypothetical protein QBC36DRAFT_332332 [Podospora setosa]
MSGNSSQRNDPLDDSRPWWYPRVPSSSGRRERIPDERRPTAPNTTTSGEFHRAIARYNRNIERVRRNLDAVDNRRYDPESSMSSADRDLRRRFNRDPPTTNEPPTSASGISAVPPSLPPLRSLGSRARPGMASGSGSRSSRYRPGERLLERHRATNFDSRSNNTSYDELPDANSHLRALLDLSNISTVIPPLAPTGMTPPSHSQDTAEDNRRIKRRKLDSDKIGPRFKGFHYGHYGQLEPGRLTMEIVSCDGGLYQESLQYPPENILKNDDSVYCTKGNRCNIILRHTGATVFSLTELVIKAPGSSYSCPVREGMVFVAMKSDELLTRTAQYQIQYLPPQQGTSNTLVYSVRHEEDGSSITRLQPPVREFSFGLDDDEDYRTAQIPPEFAVPPPPFNITTECTDDGSDDDDGRVLSSHLRSRNRRTPNRIGSLPFESESSEEDRDPWGNPSSDWRAFDNLTRRRYAARGGGRQHDSVSSTTLEEAQEASQIATQEALRAVGGELMAPLAHFFIEKDKNKCTIRFDPPVSGRFILLKMWSPPQDLSDRSSNIDIEAVIAQGFAGPRYFPSVELA